MAMAVQMRDESAHDPAGRWTPCECDLLVIGGGAAGLSAAVTAAYHGLKVIVAEKAPVLGGATAWSGGWMWAPLNPLSQADGIVEDIDEPRTYLKHALGEQLRRAAGRGAAAERPAHGGVLREQDRRCSSSAAAGSPTSRATCPAPEPAAGRSDRSRSTPAGSARTCGRWSGRSCTRRRSWAWASWPAPTCRRSCTPRRRSRSFFHAAWRVAFHVLDLITYRRGMQLVNGPALIARLVKSADELGVQMWVDSPATQPDHRRRRRGHRRGAAAPGRARSRCGPARVCCSPPAASRTTSQRRAELFPRTPTGKEHWTLAPKETTGDGVTLGESVGGRAGHRRWPRRPRGARCRWCRTGTAGSGPTRTSSTAASPA